MNDLRIRIPQPYQAPGGCLLTACSVDPNFATSSIKIEAMGPSFTSTRTTLKIQPRPISFSSPIPPDHLSLPDIARIVKKETLITCPQRSVKRLAAYPTRKVKPGDVFNLGEIQCEAVPAYNKWLPLHLKPFKF